MRSKENELLFIYLLFDLFLLNISIVLVAFLNPYIPFLQSSQPLNYNYYLLQGNLSWIITYIVFTKRNLYLRDGFYNRFKRISFRLLVFILISLMIQSLLVSSTFHRLFFYKYVLVFYISKQLFYWLLYSYLEYKRNHGFYNNRVLIVGLNDTSKQLRNLIETNSILGYKFVGYISSQSPVDHPEILGNHEDLMEVMQKHKIQLLFVTISLFEETHNSKEYLRLCNKMGVRLRYVPENQRWLKSKINMESIGNMSIINPLEIPLDNLENRFLKRGFDLIFSTLFLLFIFSWLGFILALLIKLSSKGPVFFVQERTGINNKTFKCYKFRSMTVNDMCDSLQATENDERITTIGKFLRRTNLDEIPQFINVFLSQMSVVGPRPHMIKHTLQYSGLIEQYLVRHYVKPGVTGWAQVNGMRGETNELWKMEKRVEFDMEYIENWNFWWDIKIILRTVSDKRTFNNAG